MHKLLSDTLNTLHLISERSPSSKEPGIKAGAEAFVESPSEAIPVIYHHVLHLMGYVMPVQDTVLVCVRACALVFLSVHDSR